MPTDEATRKRPRIAPDDGDSHRAMIVSQAMLEEMAWEWYLHGMASTSCTVHGEAEVLQASAMRAEIRAAFERLWAVRRRG